MIELLIGWVVCGYLAAGLSFAFFQKKYPSIAAEHRASDVRQCVLVFFVGPAGLIAALFTCGIKHGLLYPWTKETGESE